MKYYSRLKQYKASNLVYDTESQQAYSYEWYCLAKRFPNGMMIVNSHNYSSTTIRHYYKIMRLLDNLGIEYQCINAPRGLQNLESARVWYQSEINSLQAKIDNPRTKKTLNALRQQTIDNCKNQLILIDKLNSL